MRLRKLFLFMFLISLNPLVYADLIDELGDAKGYTVAHKGFIVRLSKAGSIEDVVLLDNNQVFTLNCIMLPPSKYTKVVVFAKENTLLTSKSEYLPPNLKYNYKLLLNDKLCNAFLDLDSNKKLE